MMRMMFLTLFILINVSQFQAQDTVKNDDSATLDERSLPPMVSVVKAFLLKKGGVKVTWVEILDSDVKGYYIYRCLLPNGVYTRINQKAIADEMYIDQRGTRDYYYRVRAVNNSEQEGNWSNFTATVPEEEE